MDESEVFCLYIQYREEENKANNIEEKRNESKFIQLIKSNKLNEQSLYFCFHPTVYVPVFVLNVRVILLITEFV